MAGRAQLKALVTELDRRTSQAFEGWEGDEAPTHLDYVCLRIEDGTTTKDLAIELEKTLGFEFGYSRMMRYLTREWPDAESRVDSARARASHWLVDDAKTIVDEANPMTVQVASARARQRNWMAERYNPGRFGQQKQTNVAISITTLHLDALRTRPNIVTGGHLDAFASVSGVEVTQAQVMDTQPLSTHLITPSAYTGD